MLLQLKLSSAFIYLCVSITSTAAQALTVDCGARGEAVQGVVHSISCEGLASGTDVTWRFVPFSDTNLVTVGTCTANNACSPANPALYEVSRANGTSEVRVQRVERDGKTVVGEWRCQQDGTSKACTVSKVIWGPVVNRGQCSVSFNEYQHEVNAECHIVKVFPEATCQWTYKRVGFTSQDVSSSNVKVSRREYADANGEVFFEIFCTIDKMTLPKEEGDYEFRVVISPGAVAPSMVFNGSNIIAKPRTPILNNCMTGYIDLSTNPLGTIICRCETESMGSPTGLLQWIHPENYVILSEKTPVIDLLLKAVDKTFSSRTFTCVVQHHTGPVNVTYAPKLAYGPVSVTVIDETVNGSEYNTFRCSVREVNPTPEITWAGGIEIQGQEPTKPDGSAYVNVIVFKAKEGTPVTCSAKNPQRENSLKSHTLPVKGPNHTPTGASSSLTPAWFLTVALFMTTVCL